MKNKLILLDSNSLLNRAYYAIPPLNGIDGTPTNAVYGFINMFIKLIGEQQPTHVAAAFDLPEPTFRKKMCESYKADRKGMPDDLAVQVPVLKNLLKLMGVAIVEKSGYEADDVIGTLAKKFDFDTVIVTGDRDSLQLIDENTRVLFTKRGISDVVECRVDNVAEIYGVEAFQVVDLKSIMGDASDSIKGVAGIGKVTALKLINEYGSLRAIYENLDKIGGKVAEKLVNGKDDAELSYKLAKIDCDVPLSVGLDDLEFEYPFEESVKSEILKLGFKSIAVRLKFKSGADNPNAVLPPVSAEKTEIVKIKDKNALISIVEEIKTIGSMAYVGGKNIKIATSVDKNYDIIVKDGFFSEGLEISEYFGLIKTVLENPQINKICFDYKTEKHLLEPAEIELKGLSEDVMLEAYCVNSSVVYKSFEELAGMLGIEPDDGAAGVLKAHDYLKNEIERLELKHVYYDVELPLVEVLYYMEKTGFSVDTAMLERLGAQYRDKLETLTSEIYAEAGEKFNLNSPKQLGTILFDKLKLNHPRKKNKSGNYSTDAETLEKLRYDHPIISLILEYRDISKLQSTYIEGMRPLVRDGKIHTVFKQAVTSTGRLSSTEPNLQNIPIRKEEGAKLRAVFIASEGCKLVCADYSQIELRLMAAFSCDPTLLAAFERGDDIHSVTAAAAYGVPLEFVTPSMRRSAKAVNFGIIYGMSDFGLAADLGVPLREAKRFITKFFETYPKIKEYIDANVSSAKENGYIRSMSGRLRFFPEFRSGKFALRQFAERAAMNMPLQGSASDIIKTAMIRADKAFKEHNLKGKLIMQVHDELIADVPENEVETAVKLLKDAMENAADMKVKLVAEAKVGINWQEAK